MGYTLTIIERGTAKSNTYHHDNNAPADGSPTDHTNSRWPSYSAWADYARDSQTVHIWDEILKNHPGRKAITNRMKEAILAVNVEHLKHYNRGRHEWLCYWLRKFQHPTILNW